MGADKRSVATDALETLGTLIGPNEKRDAIHLGVDPATAGETLTPGMHVTLRDGQAFCAEPNKGLGIVDPFLTGRVKRGERFWLVVYPRQITSLRHIWEHPGFPSSTDVPTQEVDLGLMRSKAFIDELAASVDLSTNRLMAGAKEYIRHGEYITGGSEMEGEYVPDEFWNHYARVTKTDVPEEKRGNFFKCSC